MEDCFACRRNSCTALKVKKCEGCSFYKTKEQFKQDQLKAIEKILSLAAERREHIIKTYYNGRLEVEIHEG